jgi:hypothetical protein
MKIPPLPQKHFVKLAVHPIKSGVKPPLLLGAGCAVNLLLSLNGRKPRFVPGKARPEPAA